MQPNNPVPGFTPTNTPVDIKPPELNWSGITKGGNFRNMPATDFVGRVIRVTTALNNFKSWVARIDFDDVQVFSSTAPWTNKELSLEIKISKNEPSAWSIFGDSLAEVFKVKREQLDPNKLVGNYFHMQQSEVDFGVDRKTGTLTKGRVWKVLGITTSGVPVKLPVAPVTSMASTLASPNGAIKISALDQAIKLLGGRTQEEFFGMAISDPIVREDAAVLTKVAQGTLIAELISSGKAVKGADNKYTITA